MGSGKGQNIDRQSKHTNPPPDSRFAKGAENLKVLSVTPNYHRRCFELETKDQTYTFPFARIPHDINASKRVTSVFSDPELANEGFTYELESGESESVLLDQVLYYNRDPAILNDLFLFDLTCEVHKALDGSKLSKRELIRQLGTSSSQFYRLLDTTNYAKSAGQMIALLHLLGKSVDVTVRPHSDELTSHPQLKTSGEMSTRDPIDL
jgi:hypothetical protein